MRAMSWSSHRSTTTRQVSRWTVGLLAASSIVATGGVIGASPASAAAFTGGDVVVVRVGTGTGALGSTATAVFLDEYSPSGTLVQSVPLPAGAGGLTMSGSATSEGALSRTTDGRYLTLAGYGAAAGTAGVASTSSAAVPRVVARVGADGSADTTTALTDAHTGNNVRGAVSDDGTRFWTTGGAGGIRYATLGATTSAVVSGGTTVTNFRVPAIAGGQLYASSSSGAATGVNRVGTGLPTSGAGIAPVLSPVPASPFAYVFLDRSAAVPGVDSLYVADDTSSTGGVLKYSFDGTSWTARGTFRPANEAARGLTGQMAADGSVRLVATTATTTSLVQVTDTAAFDVTLAGAGTTLATPAANTAFRGVAFAPVGAVPPTAPAITTQPQGTTIASGATATLTVSATGTAPLSYQWYRGTPGDTSNPVGSDSGSFTTPALTATTSYFVRITDAAGSLDSAAATVTVQAAPPVDTPPTIAPGVLTPLALTLGDPWNPPADRTVTVGDAESAASALTVSVSSSDPAVATGAASGTDAVRSIDVTPVGVGRATLTITVGDGELTASGSMQVGVSAALPAGSLNHYGISDVSTAVDLGGGFMAVGDDETNVLRVYDRAKSRYPASELDLRAAGLSLPDAGAAREIDVEASARSGDTVYWLGSQGQNSSGNTRLNRQMLFTTTVNGSGPATTLRVAGSYRNLRSDLIAWDAAHGDRYGLAAAATRAPEPDGVNLEGAEFAPDGTTLYIAFRGPLTPSGKALIVPVTNIADLVTANPTTGMSATFGTPVEMDLGGRGIREIRRNAAGQYLLVAGPSGAGAGAAGEFSLYSWNGVATSAAQPRSGSLDALAASGSIETIVDVPSPLADAGQVQLLTDSGDTVWYGDGVADKDLAAPQLRKVVSSRVTVGAAPVCSTDDVPVGSVQGTGDVSPVTGTSVTVQGTVVGDYEGPSPALRGFYLQDSGDGDPATSDGVFVFNNLGGTSGNSVAVGQVVQVTGAVSEFQGQTQIGATALEVCAGTGSPAPVDLSLPRTSAGDLEAYEGMLVRFHQTLTVTEHFQLGRFGQVVVSGGGRLRQPTAVHAPGSPEAAALAAANAVDTLIVDDATNAQNPDPIAFGRDGDPLSATNTLRGGDTLTDPVGVLTYTWSGNAASGNAYRLRPIGALGGAARFLADNPRPVGAPVVAGSLKVASANLLNLFNTFGSTACANGVGGAAVECRGAENTTEYDRQLAKEVASLRSLDADVIGVMELENDGYGPTSAIAALVDALNAVDGPGFWSFVDVDAGTGVTDAAGTDAIKAALLYRTGEVTPVPGATFTDAAAGAFERNPVAQTFQTAAGARVTVIANHFKSKGSCPTAAGDPNADAGDGQGCWNVRRTQEAGELARWIDATVVPGAGDPDVLIVGDLNSYAQEDPIKVLEAAGYLNLPKAFGGDDAYSYVFDGRWGYLDYALSSASLTPQVAGAVEAHVNADEPSVLDYNTNFKTPGQIGSLYAPDRFRNSDHDPIVSGLDLAVGAGFTGSAGGGTVGVAYSATFTASGTAPVTFAVTSGALPAGLSLSATGVITGTPTTSGTSTFQIRASNAAGAQTRSFSVFVAKARSATAVTSSSPTLKYHGAVRWTARVTSVNGGGTLTGNVQFKVAGTALGAPVALVGGVATSRAETNLPPGASTVTAVFSGNPTLMASQGTYVQRVSLDVALTSPVAGARYAPGAIVPIRVRLGDVNGVAVPDSLATAYQAACRVRVAAAGAQTLTSVCAASYDPATQLFTYDWPTSSTGQVGSVRVSTAVTNPGVATAQQTGVSVVVRR